MNYRVEELFLPLPHSRRFCPAVHVTSEMFSWNFLLYSYCHLFHFIYYTDSYVSVVTYIWTRFISLTCFATLCIVDCINLVSFSGGVEGEGTQKKLYLLSP